MGNRVSARTSKQLMEDLRQEFNNRCAYCETSLAVGDGVIERVYPQSKYPELATDPSNLVLSCRLCNIHKGATFPTDANGQPVLLHPRLDSYDEHFQIDADGKAVSLTARGAATIDVLGLNRPQLVDRRKAEKLFAAYFQEYDKNRPDAALVFRMSVGIVRSLAARTSALGGPSQGMSDAEARYLRNLLYANVVGALEAYLSDTLISAVTRNQKSLRRFVESFLDFKREKFELREVFERHGTIRDRAIIAMRDIIYHDLPKVNGIYRDALGFELPDIGELMKCVLVRHDIVHRNGKSKDGTVQSVSQAELEALCDAAAAFVAEVEESVRTAIALEAGDGTTNAGV
jgi:uncharacterized protein (TIGR02646 family)